ncbi:MAG: ATP-binding protein [Deltaproteobacteria bacterium]|nr:ATP-binding protein [Deltaproteobacteria bacterium]
MYKRIQQLNLSSQETCFIWGPRQTGKSTLLKMLFPQAIRYDLLLSTEYQRLLREPSLIREQCLAQGLDANSQRDPIIIDEIQKIPTLLDEVHWLMENKGLRFILCGSSARKLRRGHANLLGGRAIRYELYPLIFPEIPAFSLIKALNSGLIPRHYDSARSSRLIQSYVGDYLKEEIAAEALTRNIPAFSRFLEVAALSNGEILNYSNIARECGISSPTVKEYFQILEDTLIGRQLPAFRKRKKRRLVTSPKFYFFDLSPVIHFSRRGKVVPGSELFGRAFEHYIWMEIVAHSSYSGLFYAMSYWRTSSGFEVDFILGDHEIAIEVKSTELAHTTHLKGLRRFKEEYSARRSILVSLDAKPRMTEDGIEILPWQIFLERLWGGEIYR